MSMSPEKKDGQAELLPTPKYDRELAELSLVAEKDDLARWREGANNFLVMWQEYSSSGPISNKSIGFVGQLQALYLGERACIFRDSFDEELCERVLSDQSYNFVEGNGLIFRTDIVEKIMSDNPDVFMGSSTADMITNLKLGNDAEQSLEMGLLLGFPREDVEKYNNGCWLYEGIAKVIYGFGSKPKIQLSDVELRALEKMAAFNFEYQDGPEEPRDMLIRLMMRAQEEGVITSDEVEKTINSFDFVRTNPSRGVHLYNINYATYSNSICHPARIVNAFSSSGILLPQQKQAQAEAINMVRSEKATLRQNEAYEKCLAITNSILARIGKIESRDLDPEAGKLLKEVKKRTQDNLVGVGLQRMLDSINIISNAESVMKMLPGSDGYKEHMQDAATSSIAAKEQFMTDHEEFYTEANSIVEIINKF